MEEAKDAGKIKVITFDGYKAACFANSNENKKALEIVKNHNLDIAILGMPIDSDNPSLGYTLHITTAKTTVNVKRLAILLIEQGKRNDLYWKHNGVNSEKSARVHAANLKLIE